MREIKFRAWDRTTKEMISAENWYFSDQFEPFIDSVASAQQRHDVMQYTGLKDKSGVEIYEGDIVRVFMNHIVDLAPELPDSEYTYKVWFDETTACFKFHDMTLNYVMLRDQFHKLEVIGNIYENSDLLTKEMEVEV